VRAPILVAEATRRSGVVWVSTESTAPALLWHLWHDDRMYVVGGGAEQRLPVTFGRALVTVRSAASQSGRVVEWAAEVDVVEPGTPLWQEIAPLLAASRLNAVDTLGQLERWARESTVLRFCPVARHPDDLPHLVANCGASTARCGRSATGWPEDAATDPVRPA
jgi:hypothetical protein